LFFNFSLLSKNQLCLSYNIYHPFSSYFYILLTGINAA